MLAWIVPHRCSHSVHSFSKQAQSTLTKHQTDLYQFWQLSEHEPHWLIHITATADDYNQLHTCLLANTSNTASRNSSSASILISSSRASPTLSLSLLSTTKISPTCTHTHTHMVHDISWHQTEIYSSTITIFINSAAHQLRLKNSSVPKSTVKGYTLHTFL